MTIAEFELVAGSFGRCELVRGVVVQQPQCGALQCRACARICGILGTASDKAKSGRLYSNEAGFVTEPTLNTVRGVDVLYLSYDRLPKGQCSEGFLHIPPELIVEVKGNDDSWTDLKKKVVEYHKAGVDLVWLVDPKTRSVRIYPKGGERVLKHENEMIDGGVALPKFKCEIARFFEN